MGMIWRHYKDFKKQAMEGIYERAELNIQSKNATLNYLSNWKGNI